MEIVWSGICQGGGLGHGLEQVRGVGGDKCSVLGQGQGQGGVLECIRDSVKEKAPKCGQMFPMAAKATRSEGAMSPQGQVQTTWRGSLQGGQGRTAAWRIGWRSGPRLEAWWVQSKDTSGTVGQMPSCGSVGMNQDGLTSLFLHPSGRCCTQGAGQRREHWT